MTLVHIKSPELTSEQKKRIGDRVISAFHGEGFSSGSVVVLFEREVADLFLDGGLLFEAQASAGADPLPANTFREPPPVPAPPAPIPLGILDPATDFKHKLRRSKAELQDLKSQLVFKLQTKGVLSSFQAQLELGLKACEWAPATLRRFFSELEEDGVIAKQGQKRGTRYVWQGITSQQAPTALVPKLVKRPEED